MKAWIKNLGYIHITKNLAIIQKELGFPGSSVGNESACNAGDPSSIPGLRRSPGERNSNPLQYSSLENPYGQRSLAGYSPWGRKESDTTEQLSTAHPSQDITFRGRR